MCVLDRKIPSEDIHSSLETCSVSFFPGHRLNDNGVHCLNEMICRRSKKDCVFSLRFLIKLFLARWCFVCFLLSIKLKSEYVMTHLRRWERLDYDTHFCFVSEGRNFFLFVSWAGADKRGGRREEKGIILNFVHLALSLSHTHANTHIHSRKAGRKKKVDRA